MCETLQLNWKLPPATCKKTAGPAKATTSSKAKKGSKKDKSYTLRAASVKKRQDAEQPKKQPKKRGPKPRPKPQPMSKYRRKTANLRERLRMGEINTAIIA